MAMRYFNIIPTELVLETSSMISKKVLVDLSRRFIEAFGVERKLASVIGGLTDVEDTPKLRHWISVCRTMLRAKLKSLDPEPRFMAHFYVDSLSAGRISELHALRALEIVFESNLLNGRSFKWTSDEIKPPKYWNIFRAGTIEISEEETGIRLVSNINGGLAEFGNTCVKVSRKNRNLTFDGNIRVRQEHICETSFGTVVIPSDTPGLADCFQSNAPIIRGKCAVEQWIGTFQSAIEIIADVDLDTACDCIKLCPAVLPLHTGGTSYGSSSPEEIMGLVFLPGVNDPYDVAECFLHEAMHQKLFRAEAASPIFEEEKGDEEAYYSPWRADPRPLRMLVHGAYVFTGVARFWLRLSSKILDRPENKENALFHTYYRIRQSEDALKIVRKYGGLTTFGNKIVGSIENEINEINRINQNDVLPATVVREAEDRISGHLEKYSHYKS